MPLCSSAECVGDCSNGHQKGLNYSPKSLFRPDELGRGRKQIKQLQSKTFKVERDSVLELV